MVPAPLSPARVASLLDAHAAFESIELVPSIRAWRAEDEIPLWSALEAEVGHELGPPYYATPWPGAQLLALAVSEGILAVEGKRVLDVGAGSGVASVACARRGAHVVACDADPLACAAAAALAERHGVELEVVCADALAPDELSTDFDVVLAGDLVYSRSQGERLPRAVERWRRTGARIALADGERPYFDPCGLDEALSALVHVPRSIEGARLRTARLYLGGGSGRSVLPSGRRAKRPASRGCTGPSLDHGQPPKRVRW
jgi:predicted nicotinamide N-methyase